MGPYVTKYFVALGICVTFSMGLAPTVMFILSLTQPCMPPLISALGILPCTSWTDDTSGIFVRVSVGMFEMYTWTVIIGVSGFAFMILLLYPVEVNLLLIKGMERLVV